jgi:hypothetical protein
MVQRHKPPHALVMRGLNSDGGGPLSPLSLSAAQTAVVNTKDTAKATEVKMDFGSLMAFSFPRVAFTSARWSGLWRGCSPSGAHRIPPSQPQHPPAATSDSLANAMQGDTIGDYFAITSNSACISPERSLECGATCGYGGHIWRHWSSIQKRRVVRPS